MSLKNIVIEYLESEPQFRERSKKDRGIVNLLINKYGLQPAIARGEITKDRIIAMVQDYASMDRAWRKSLEDNPKWRGKDYDEKDELEAKKMSELGYNTPRDVGPRDAVEKEKQQPLLP